MADLENGPHSLDVDLDEPDKFYLRVEGVFSLREDAEAAMSLMEDAVGKYNGELIDAEIEPPEQHSVRTEPTDEEQTRRGSYPPDSRQENDPTL